MTQHRARTAVCLVRAEKQDPGLLITLLMSNDVERGLTLSPKVVVGIDEAVEEVRRFLTTFAARIDA